MSRSKRRPYYTDQQKGGRKDDKRKANKTVRNLKRGEAPANGKAYRKYSESYDIRDWSFHMPEDKKAYRK